MILDIYKDSFEFSSKNISILLVMGVLSFFNFLIIPLIIVRGYDYKVIKESTNSMINGDDEPPEFNDYKSLFKDGLKYVIVRICYFIVPIVLLISAVYFKGSIGIVLFLLGILFFILSSLFLYMAIPHMAFNNSLKSAFELRELYNIMKTIGLLRYFSTYVGILIINVVVFAVVFVLLMIVFGILGIACLSLHNGWSTVSLLGFFVINFVLLFLVNPYMSLFYDRCSGLLYNIR